MKNKKKLKINERKNKTIINEIFQPLLKEKNRRIKKKEIL
jgi:hypothetical protein